ncbi:MAG: peptide-methionine (R)-S-oxide reductase MsrB [Candidatus Magasanikbacteria bacterium]|nr:peptide-methionine (R)-S-oxide reductase MsrB [Candidatus Magasanikbacteria bacterium]
MPLSSPNKSNEEWKKELPPEVYRITRAGGTEPAFSGAYWDCHDPGTYACSNCSAPLFSSATKFDSGTGWPSFYQPLNNEAVAERPDESQGMRRTEVVCQACGAHLGHVFPDGPKPIGQRYCINSLALQLKKE